MELTVNKEELEEAIERLNDGGRWITLKQVNALLNAGYTKQSSSETWTGYYRGVKNEGNIIFPEWG